MQTTSTWEMRWFQAGIIPATVQQWFEHHCLGEWLDPHEIREDIYLPTPGCQKLSLKKREDHLELKWCQSEGEFLSFGIRQDDWQGKLEKWVKWTYKNLASSDCLSPSDMTKQSGLIIKKKRSQRIYQDVECELTQLTVNHQNWWTIGLEMLDTPNHSRIHFVERVKKISQTYYGLSLSATQSYAYPQWQIIHDLG
jgi:hypothetical protein